MKGRRSKGKNAGGVLKSVATLCAVWLVLAAAEVSLSALVDKSGLCQQELPLEGRAALMAYDLLICALFVLVVAGPVTAVFLLVGRLLGKKPWARRTCFFVPVLTASALMFLYVATWGTFWSVGCFLNRDGLEFWAAQPVQIFYFAIPALLYAGLPLAAAMGVLLGWLVPGWVWRRGRGTSICILSVTLGLLVLCTILWRVGERRTRHLTEAVRDPFAGMPYLMSLFYEDLRDNRAGAFAHCFSELMDAAYPPPDRTGELRLSPGLRLIRRTLMGMDEFVSGKEYEPLNVIIILVESLRADRLRECGGRRDVMPAVDRIARESLVFCNAYAQASHSNYADVAPLSSHYPLRSHRTHFYPENPSYPRVMIYDVLKALGYRVGVFSSQNEHWGKLINYLDTGSIDHLMHAATWKGPTCVPEEDTGFARWTAETKHAGSVDDRYTVDEAVRWIGSLEGKPFFIYMNLQNSHFPYVVPEGFMRPFGPESIDFAMAFNNYPREKAPVVEDLYDDSLRYVDRQLARLFDRLRREGLWDRTIIVLTGDTGQAFYEHGFACHANALYNEVMLVPLVVRAPGLEPGVHEGPAQHVDVPPTILGLMGLPPHPGWQGVDLLDPGVDTDRSIYLVAHTPITHQYAIVRGGRKLLYDFRLGRIALYDLENDPGETVDISRRNPELFRRLSNRLDSWRYAQIEYYTNPFLHRRWYPPILAEN